MFFDTTIAVLNMNVIATESNVELHLLVGAQIPQDDGSVGALPLGMLRVPMGRDITIKIGKDLVEGGESLPEPKKEKEVILPDAGTTASVNAATKQQETQSGS